VNSIKSDIQAILRRHRGRQNAISRRDLLEALEADSSYDRKLRLMIGELRREGEAILFATSKPAGYYYPDSLAEVAQGERKILSYIIDLCILKRALKRSGSRYIASEYQEKLI
jgi:hypothetical protein